MIELNEIPEKYKVDRLFLLIGTNPLPNYVAARLLARPKAHICLLHTQETEPVAGRLRRILRRYLPGVQIEGYEIAMADNVLIREQATKILNDLRRQDGVNPKASVGLHYTGGTAAMSVHTYAAIEQFFNDSHIQVTYSYLDARTLSMRFDGHGGESATLVAVAEKCPVSLSDIAQLHGYEDFTTKLSRERIDEKRAEVLRAIATSRSTMEGNREWNDFVNSKQVLPSLTLFPRLKPYHEVLIKHFGNQPKESDVAQFLGKKTNLASCQEWFRGKWLEEYTLLAIQKLAGEFKFSDFAINVEPKRLESDRFNAFELDVVVTRGYQLFAISCQAGVNLKKGDYKEHLFEVYVRARQLGGDEARTALVCQYDRPLELQKEVQETWFSEGRIRVFGLPDIQNLEAALSDWFKTANR